MFNFPFTVLVKQQQQQQSWLSWWCLAALSVWQHRGGGRHKTYNEIILSRLEYNTMRKKIKHQWENVERQNTKSPLWSAVPWFRCRTWESKTFTITNTPYDTLTDWERPYHFLFLFFKNSLGTLWSWCRKLFSITSQPSLSLTDLIFKYNSTTLSRLLPTPLSLAPTLMPYLGWLPCITRPSSHTTKSFDLDTGCFLGLNHCEARLYKCASSVP